MDSKKWEIGGSDPLLDMIDMFEHETPLPKTTDEWVKQAFAKQAAAAAAAATSEVN